MASIIEPFRVLPWDFFPDDNAAPPHVEAIQISRAPRRFELLKRGTRVYFRLHNDNSRVWVTLDDNDDIDVVRTFRRAIGSGRIGRVFERGEWQIYRPEYEPIAAFQFLVSGWGETQIRPWCATQWLTLVANLMVEAPGKMTAEIVRDIVLAPGWNPRVNTKMVTGDEWYDLQEDTPDEASKILTQTRFVRGDALTLKRLTAPFVRAENRNYQDFNPFYSTAPPKFPTLNPAALEFIYPAPLHQLIAQHFAIAGVNWPVDFYYCPDSYWKTEPPSHSLRLGTATAHDRLEDALFLRDWLSDKLEKTHIERIFNSRWISI